jgi:hypothetical protein
MFALLACTVAGIGCTSGQLDEIPEQGKHLDALVEVDVPVSVLLGHFRRCSNIAAIPMVPMARHTATSATTIGASFPAESL